MKEFHWFEDGTGQRAYALNHLDDGITYCVDFKKTYQAILSNTPFILSTQSHFFTTDTLARGYGLFAHFSNGKVAEVKLGKNACTNREIRKEHNLEKLLLSGEFGGLSDAT